MGVLRACAFSKDSTISLIRSDLFGVSSTSESEGDSALLTSLLRAMQKEYPPQWEAAYDLIQEIIRGDGEKRPAPGTCEEVDSTETIPQRIRCLDKSLLHQTISQAIRYTKFLADSLNPDEERLHYQMMQAVELKRVPDL